MSPTRIKTGTWRMYTTPCSFDNFCDHERTTTQRNRAKLAKLNTTENRQKSRYKGIPCSWWEEGWVLINVTSLPIHHSTELAYSELPDGSPLYAPLPPEATPLIVEFPTTLALWSCLNRNTSRGGGRLCAAGVSSSSSVPVNRTTDQPQNSVMYNFIDHWPFKFSEISRLCDNLRCKRLRNNLNNKQRSPTYVSQSRYRPSSRPSFQRHPTCGLQN